MTYTGAACPAEDTQLLIVKLTAVCTNHRHHSDNDKYGQRSSHVVVHLILANNDSISSKAAAAVTQQQM